MNKTRAYNLLDFSLWILNPFLIVLLIFEQKINVGVLLLWTGKLHPLALHFPIVFGILIAGYFLFFEKVRFAFEMEKLLIAINAFFAVVVAILGFFLAKDGEYQGDIFNFHKWGGVAIAMLSWLFLFILRLNPVLKKIVALIFLIVLIGATHKGAQLTHGVNALEFPYSELKGEESISELDSSISIYQLAVQPILEQKCVSCHGLDKVKGDLRLDSPEQIKAGGENGDILSGNSMMMSLIHLPKEDENHMPPEGKEQLSKEEIELLENWINEGADFEMALKELNEEEDLLLAVNKYLTTINDIEEINTDLPELDEYNTDYCTVSYLFYGSDKVEVNFFQASFYNNETLNKLLSIKESIIQLNMQNMPLSKDDLDIILQFNKLEKLNLNSTGLKISDLESLKNLEKLKAVSICGIEFNESELDDFLSKSKFQAVNVWADNVSREKLESITRKYQDIQFTIGDNLEGKVLKINQPIIEQDSLIIRNRLEVKLKHLLNGVEIYYTTDGSKPDSLGFKYSEPLWLTENTKIKARAYKDGWISSDVVQRTFYKSGIVADSLYLLSDPHPRYPGRGAKTLNNLVLGERNIQNGEWLAYKDYDMEFMVRFTEDKVLKSVQLNALTAIPQHIFPIKSIFVKGSRDGQNFEQIAKATFDEANKRSPRGAELYGVEFPDGTEYKYYRITVKNLKKMPDWHAAKGKPAWVFVDEIFLN